MLNLLLMAAMFLVGAAVYFSVGFGALKVLFCYVPLTRRLGRLFPGGIKRARMGLSFGIEFACRAALCLGAAALELYFGGEFAAGGFISGAIMAFGLSVGQLNVRGREESSSRPRFFIFRRASSSRCRAGAGSRRRSRAPRRLRGQRRGRSRR